jgi:hypothetical protein
VQSEIAIIQIPNETLQAAKYFPRKIDNLPPGRLAMNTQLFPSSSALTLGVVHKIKERRLTRAINVIVSNDVKS